MEQKQVSIAIKKIKEIEFFVNEEVDIVSPPVTNVNFELKTNISLADKSVELLLTAFFSDPSQGDIFMRIKISNVFLISELVDFYNPENNSFNIPNNIMVTLLSLSISHTRALLAKNASGTKFADLYLPIVNPGEIFNQLFGAQ